MNKKDTKKISNLLKIGAIADILLIIVGFSLLIFGLYQIYVPSAYVIGGSAILFAGYKKKPKKLKDKT